MRASVSEIRERLSSLIKEGAKLGRQVERYVAALAQSGLGTSQSPSPSFERRGLAYERALVRWRHNTVSVLEYAGLFRQLDAFRLIGSTTNHLTRLYTECLCGLLESVVDQLDSGFIGSIRELLHADLFDSLVEQAEHLLQEGHQVPAAVLGRVVLERWLRERATEAGIPVEERTPASKLNDDLKAAGVFKKGMWRSVLTSLDTGNAAAHGKLDELEPVAVEELLKNVKRWCGED